MRRICYIPVDIDKPVELIDIDTIDPLSTMQGDPYRVAKHLVERRNDHVPYWGEMLGVQPFNNTALMVDEEGGLKQLDTNMRVLTDDLYPTALVGDVIVFRFTTKTDLEDNGRIIEIVDLSPHRCRMMGITL